MRSIGDLMNPVEPEREAMPWRLRSWWCAIADVIGAAVGIGLYAVTGIDSVVSWPSNQVLLSDPDLSNIAMVLLVPTWLWLLMSAGMLPERVRYWSPWKMPVRPRICFGAAAVVCAAVIFVGFAVGAAKGAVRILPGPRYQVSINQAAWTTVPLNQFHYWQACFVREDGPFMLFGLAAGTVFIAVLYLRREAASDGA
jgi:hypothetical protein